MILIKFFISTRITQTNLCSSLLYRTIYQISSILQLLFLHIRYSASLETIEFPDRVNRHVRFTFIIISVQNCLRIPFVHVISKP